MLLGNETARDDDAEKGEDIDTGKDQDKVTPENSRLERLERLMENTIMVIGEMSQGQKRKYDEYTEEDEGEEIGEKEEVLITEKEQINDNEEWLTDDEDEEEGPPIDGEVAKYIDQKLTKRLTRDKIKKKTERQKKPKNVRYGKEIKINGAIYSKMSATSRKRDYALRSIQGYVVKSVIATGKVETKVIEASKNKEDKSAAALAQKMFNDIFDGMTMGCQASYQLNMRRVCTYFDIIP